MRARKHADFGPDRANLARSPTIRPQAVAQNGRADHALEQLVEGRAHFLAGIALVFAFDGGGELLDRALADLVGPFHAHNLVRIVDSSAQRLTNDAFDL